ncbi:MAG: exodeoxyribonuclease III [Gammaproteobacteria bacterium]|nr:exodeoxyribonuclease III [Gammaproteobacteria bacterium]
MRIISINVNGLHNAVAGGLLGWLERQDADVICLQDTRIDAADIDNPDLQLQGYQAFASSGEDPAQNGVALYTRIQPRAVITTLGFEGCDRHGRYIQADFDKISIGSLLFPHGRDGDAALNEKFKFMEDLGRHLDKQRRKRRDYIYCSSAFIAHQKFDVKHWRDCQQTPGFLPTERAWLDGLIHEMGYIDALREVSRESEQFSWWPDSEQAEMLNLGWRFDYQLLTPGLKRTVRSARLFRQPRFSEHAPLQVDYDWTLSF